MIPLPVFVAGAAVLVFGIFFGVTLVGGWILRRLAARRAGHG